MIIGIDFGSTLTKIVLMDDFDVISSNTINRDEPYMDILNEYDLSKVSKIMITGTGASYIENDIANIPTEKVDEFKAASVGGFKLSGAHECLITSIGTGTSFTYANHEILEHAGGCGMGGALLRSLGRVGLGIDSARELLRLAEDGHLENADLLIKDISKVPVSNLGGDITVANMAKIGKDTSPSDYAYGICNLVFQNVGVMAVMAAKSYNVKTIVIMGSLAQNHVAKEMLNAVGKLFGYDFIVPENVSHGVAIGAALCGLEKFINAYSVYDNDPDDVTYHFE